MPRCTLYRHFDAQGRLLYVGISKTLMARLSGHERDSGWFWDVATIKLESFPTRGEALYAEAVAIRDENPVHNKVRPIPNRPGRAEVAPASDGDEPIRISAEFEEFVADEPVVGYTIVERPDEDLSWLKAPMVFADIEGQNLGLRNAARLVLQLDGVLATDRVDLFKAGPFRLKEISRDGRIVPRGR